MAYDRLARANKLLSTAQASGADTGRGGALGSYTPLAAPTKVVNTVQPSYKTSSDFAQPAVSDPLRGIDAAIPPSTYPAPAVGAVKNTAVTKTANAPKLPGSINPADTMVGPQLRTKGVVVNGAIQPHGDLVDPVAGAAFRRQAQDRAADQQAFGGDQNAGYVGQAYSNVPGAPAITGRPMMTTNEVVGALEGKRYADSKPAYDEAGIAAAKADLARQVAFKPGSRGANYRTSAPFFNLRPRKGVEEANAAGEAAIGAINAKGGFDERIAGQNIDASRYEHEAARIEAGLERKSREGIARDGNETAVTIGIAKAQNARNQLRQRMETSAFLAQHKALEDEMGKLFLPEEKAVVKKHMEDLVREFKSSGQAESAGIQKPSDAGRIRITRGGKTGTINPADFNPATDVRL